MKNEFDDMDDLIGKVLAGEATPEEQLQLREWVSQSAANEKYYQQIKAIFDAAAANSVRLQFDTDIAWQRVKGRIKTRRKPEDNKGSGRDVSLWPLLRVAATLVLIALAGIFTYRRYFTAPVETFAMSAQTTVATDTLPDGSAAFLNKRSSIAYEYNPQDNVRKVKLKGESFFEVKHEEEKPFVIEAEEVIVRDIGTAFNVKAYPESDTVEVIVESGEVQVFTMSNPGLYLKAGETGIYDRRLKSFSRIVKADTNALAYKTGIFSFNNSDLRSLVTKINEVYDQRIVLASESLNNCRITVTFNNDTIDTIAEVIAETFHLTVTKKDKEIILDGTGCQ